ncbi:head-tail connector protein [Variovorax saccharolyticus]|uniref:head-tail connector protein n=1 Tax=Variovorax saccharolyticus TaxID=3053516 RepID=UPI002578F8F0|nr:head-tail connector protein [Variovorax sp. J31P216]MDM0024081.1 head-tail connector protein [Variovorax sp. J31P216]
MGVKVITAAAQAIPTADLRAHCNSVAADDALLVGFCLAAQGYAEHYTGRSIGSQTLELALDEFPAGAIELPQGPVTGITSIKYIDSAGTEQTLSGTLYALDDYGIQCWGVPKVDTTWPATMAAANAVKVLYVAGALPPAVRAALLLIVGNLYENREQSIVGTIVSELPLGVKSLLDTVKVWSF